jgi:serine/threonine-protein kinase HipA
MSVIAYFRLPLPKAKQILREVEAAVSRWREAGRSLGMDKRMLEAFVEAFEHPERGAAQRAMR